MGDGHRVSPDGDNLIGPNSTDFNCNLIAAPFTNQLPPQG